MRNDQANGLTTGDSALRGYPCRTATNRKGVANRNVWTDRMLDALPQECAEEMLAQHFLRRPWAILLENSSRKAFPVPDGTTVV